MVICGYMEKHTGKTFGRIGCFLISLGLAAASGACGKDIWGRQNSFTPNAECGMNPVDIILEQVRSDTAVNFQQSGDTQIILSVYSLLEDLEVDNRFMSDLYSTGIHYYEDGTVIGFAITDDREVYENFVSEGYVCDDGTLVQSFFEDSAAGNLLIIAQCDFTLSDDTESAGLCIGNIYRNCTYDSSIPLGEYDEKCDELISEFRGETSISTCCQQSCDYGITGF